jgi:hypothetical protein
VSATNRKEAISLLGDALSPDEPAGSSRAFAQSGEPVGVVLVQASTVTPERVSWAWDQRVPIGMASLLVGAGGVGKSLEIDALAAGWSRGTVPGDFFGTPVDVAIASAEDHRAAVIVPRLLAAGADLKRIQDEYCRTTDEQGVDAVLVAVPVGTEGDDSSDEDEAAAGDPPSLGLLGHHLLLAVVAVALLAHVAAPSTALPAVPVAATDDHDHEERTEGHSHKHHEQPDCDIDAPEGNAKD